MRNNTLKNRLGANIAELRIKAGMSKSTFALMIGVSRLYLSEIESGAANPTVDMLERIADGLEINVENLFAERQ